MQQHNREFAAYTKQQTQKTLSNSHFDKEANEIKPKPQQKQGGEGAAELLL